MNEKEIIENIILETEKVELPQKPLQNVLREMRKTKASKTTTKPFYRRKAFVSACACVVAAVLIIPVAMLSSIFGGTKMSNEPNPQKTSPVAPFESERSVTVDSSDFGRLRSENGILFPDSIDGIVPNCSAYTVDGNAEAISFTYGLLCELEITKNFAAKPIGNYENIIYNDFDVSYEVTETPSSIVNMFFVNDGWLYDMAVSGTFEKALDILNLFR